LLPLRCRPTTTAPSGHLVAQTDIFMSIDRKSMTDMATALAIASFLPPVFFEKRPFHFFDAGTLKQIHGLVNSLAMIFIFDARKRGAIYQSDDLMPCFIAFSERHSVYNECITLGIQSAFACASSTSMQKTLSPPSCGVSDSML
jgi:hypothetical protein